MTSIGFKSYADAVADFNKVRQNFEKTASSVARPEPEVASFAETLNNSLNEVNAMQGTKTQMIKSFASGETQNVHELMITLQKAGLAVNMTSAVRNKVLEAYKELSRIQF